MTATTSPPTSDPVPDPPPARPSTGLSSPSGREEAKQRDLAVMRRRATLLLGAMAVVFVTVVLLTDDEGWPGYLQAFAEASLVGGLADWFAVTALFRHPLGVPIPHTAVIPERKDQFGRTLGEFVQDNLLTSEALIERVRSADVVRRMADWMVDPANAAVVAGHAADVAVGLADVVRDDDVQRVLQDTVVPRLESLPVAPMAGRALTAMTAEGRHHELVDALLHGIDRLLQDNRDRLLERFSREAPWWRPEAVDRRVFDKLFEGVRTALHEVVEDPDHEFRVEFDERIRVLAAELETSPELRTKAEQLKHDLLHQSELRAWSASVWEDVKTGLRTQAADPESELRARLARSVVSVGQRLRDDPALLAKAEKVVESAAGYVAEHFHGEISDLVGVAVERWDGQEASSKLELLLGRDLQFIRINGTIVGGLAGLVIHALVAVAG